MKHAYIHSKNRKLQIKKSSGVVLVMSLIMLIIISILAISTMRNSSNTETIVNSFRTGDLAKQAAEIALRHCEGSVVSIITVANGGTSSFSTTFTASKIQNASSTPKWQDISTWDNTTTPAEVFVLPLALVNQASLSATYKRAPECIVERVETVIAGTTAVDTQKVFTVTARGFGPEVAAGTGRPLGSEVWLQSTIELD